MLACKFETLLEFERAIEMVFQGGLTPARDDQDVVDPGAKGLLDDVLDARLVDHRQHLLGLRFGRRKEAGAEARCRDHRLPNGHF